MKPLDRRKFLNQTALGIGSALLYPQLFKQFASLHGAATQPIGTQVWFVKDKLIKDFPGTLKWLAGMGYQVIEMCSPVGYIDSGFEPLTKIKGADMRRIINDTGLSCPTCHFNFGELTEKLDDTLEFAGQLGLSDLVCSSFWLPDTATLKDYLDAADKLNKVGEKVSKAGFQTGFHNHEMEFGKRDGTVIYDALMNQFDPKLVKMQFQTEVINLGYKASTYFTKYPGRFISSHMSDWSADKKQVPIGQGIIDWKEFFAAAPAGGLKHFLVEMAEPTLKESAAYLHKLLDKA